MNPWGKHPFWASLSYEERTERLFEFEERAALIEFGEGQSRGFAEASAYCTMTVGDASTWHLMSMEEIARLKMLQKIVDLHWERVQNGCQSPGLESLRNALRSGRTQ